MSVTVLSAMVADLLSGLFGRCCRLAEQAAASGLPVGQADELVADDLIRETERPLERLEALAFVGELPHDVVALGLVVDLVGEAAATPPVGSGDGSATVRDLLLDPADLLVDRLVIESGLDDDHELIGPHGASVLPVDPGVPGPPRWGQGVRLAVRW